MFRRIAVSAATMTFAGATVLLGGGTALADPPNGGCPSGGGWFLTTSDATMPGFDKGNFHDQNDDGLVCAKHHEDGSWTIKDNTNQ